MPEHNSVAVSKLFSQKEPRTQQWPVAVRLLDILDIRSFVWLIICPRKPRESAKQANIHTLQADPKS
eukprot:scaffold461937_cov20-Prasinocladus_malaysianus.AAC.1